MDPQAMDRRTLLRAAGAGAAFALLPPSLREARELAAPTGGLDVIKHVVLFMQENRSFDHYYGTMRGVRGFNEVVPVHRHHRLRARHQRPGHRHRCLGQPAHTGYTWTTYPERLEQAS